MSHCYCGIVKIALCTLAVVSCGRTYDLEPTGPHTFYTGEELDAELIVKGAPDKEWEYAESGLDPGKTFLVTLQKKPSFNREEFWSPLDPKECNEKLKEWYQTRSSHSYTGTIQSSLAFCDGPVRITCDQELYGVPPGENLSAFFTIRWKNRDVHPNVRVYGPELTVIPMSESNEYEPADEFFRIGDCIPGGFYIYPSQETDLSGLSIRMEIPVQKEMLLSYIKELQSGNPDAEIQYEKATLRAIISFKE